MWQLGTCQIPCDPKPELAYSMDVREPVDIARDLDVHSQRFVLSYLFRSRKSASLEVPLQPRCFSSCSCGNPSSSCARLTSSTLPVNCQISHYHTQGHSVTVNSSQLAAE